MTARVLSAASTASVDALMKAQNDFNAAMASNAELPQQGWSPDLIKLLALSLLAFTLCSLIISAVLLWRSRATSVQVLRTMGVISILGFSALLLVVGYSNEQLTPIIGLFGAIAGYLLGKDSPAPLAATLPRETSPPLEQTSTYSDKPVDKSFP